MPALCCHQFSSLPEAALSRRSCPPRGGSGLRSGRVDASRTADNQPTDVRARGRGATNGSGTEHHNPNRTSDNNQPKQGICDSLRARLRRCPAMLTVARIDGEIKHRMRMLDTVSRASMANLALRLGEQTAAGEAIPEYVAIRQP